MKPADDGTWAIEFIFSCLVVSRRIMDDYSHFLPPGGARWIHRRAANPKNKKQKRGEDGTLRVFGTHSNRKSMEKAEMKTVS
jgi:hypothetical protein